MRLWTAPLALALRQQGAMQWRRREEAAGCSVPVDWSQLQMATPMVAVEAAEARNRARLSPCACELRRQQRRAWVNGRAIATATGWARRAACVAAMLQMMQVAREVEAALPCRPCRSA